MSEEDLREWNRLEGEKKLNREKTKKYVKDVLRITNEDDLYDYIYVLIVIMEGEDNRINKMELD